MAKQNRVTSSTPLNQTRDKLAGIGNSIAQIPGMSGVATVIGKVTGGDRYHAPRRCQLSLLTAHHAHVHSEVAPLKPRKTVRALAQNFLFENGISDFATAFGRIQSIWGATVNIMGQNLRFGAEMMNPLMNGIVQMPASMMGKGPDPMSRLAMAIQESTIGRSPTQGISIGR